MALTHELTVLVIIIGAAAAVLVAYAIARFFIIKPPEQREPTTNQRQHQIDVRDRNRNAMESIALEERRGPRPARGRA